MELRVLEHKEQILDLLEHVKVDQWYVICYFRCRVTYKSVIATLPFEPYEGAITFTWKDLLFHPLRSYKRYYHTPIKIYAKEVENTLVFKAFTKVAKQFEWSQHYNTFIYKDVDGDK